MVERILPPEIDAQSCQIRQDEIFAKQLLREDKQRNKYLLGKRTKRDSQESQPCQEDLPYKIFMVQKHCDKESDQDPMLDEI